MSVKLSYIILLLAGAGITFLITWITREGKNGVSGQTNMHQLIYKEQEKLKQQIKGRLNDKAEVENYKIKIEGAITILQTTYSNLPIFRNNWSKFNTQLTDFYNTLQASARKITRNEIGYSNYGDESYVSSELDQAAQSIEEKFNNSFEPVFDFFKLYGRTDDSVKTERILELFKDSIKVREKIKGLTEAMKNESDRLIKVVSAVDIAIQESKSELEAQKKSIEELGKNSKDRLLMVVVLPVFAIIIVLLFVAPYLYRSHNHIILKLFEEKVILQIFTVFIMVITILLLGIGDKINGETLGTLLGGISVYILQNAMTNGKSGGTPSPDSRNTR